MPLSHPFYLDLNCSPTYTPLLASIETAFYPLCLFRHCNYLYKERVVSFILSVPIKYVLYFSSKSYTPPNTVYHIIPRSYLYSDWLMDRRHTPDRTI